jgi:hypothetical protein
MSTPARDRSLMRPGSPGERRSTALTSSCAAQFVIQSLFPKPCLTHNSGRLRSWATARELEAKPNTAARPDLRTVVAAGRATPILVKPSPHPNAV